MLCLRGSRTTKHELNPDFSGVEIANVRNKWDNVIFNHCVEFQKKICVSCLRKIFINEFISFKIYLFLFVLVFCNLHSYKHSFKLLSFKNERS